MPETGIWHFELVIRKFFYRPSVNILDSSKVISARKSWSAKFSPFFGGAWVIDAISKMNITGGKMEAISVWKRRKKKVKRKWSVEFNKATPVNRKRGKKGFSGSLKIAVFHTVWANFLFFYQVETYHVE